MSAHATVTGRKKTMWHERINPEASYASGTGGKQNHHILPCVSVRESLNANTPNVIKGVRYFTAWNVNKSDNLQMLPTVPVFQQLFGKKGGKQGHAYVPAGVAGFPCHDRGHAVYNVKVEQSLASVFSKVTVQVDKHDSITGATDVSGALDTKRGIWAGKISGRATNKTNWQLMVAGDAAGQKAFHMAV